MTRECRLLGCVRLHYAKGFCRFHYERMKNNRPLDAPYKYNNGRKAYFDWAACGTVKQYKKHYRHGIPVCEPCRKAENRRQADRKRDREKENARRRELWASDPKYRQQQRDRRAGLR